MFTQKEINEAWALAHEKGIKYFGSVGSNAKTSKSDAKTNYLTHIMYLAPSTQSGKYNVCPMASKGCAEACLFTAGHGAMENVKQARIKRTLFFFEHRPQFQACIYDELSKFRNKCKKEDRKPAVRLNGTSDIVWERIWPQLFEEFKDIQFYDYSKIYTRFLKNWKLPDNYYLTFSRSESNDKYVDLVMEENKQANIAVVFDKLPDKWRGRKVINGDDMDLRVLDPKGIIVGLTQKGEAKKDETGFVVRADNDYFVPLKITKGRALVSA